MYSGIVGTFGKITSTYIKNRLVKHGFNVHGEITTKSKMTLYVGKNTCSLLITELDKYAYTGSSTLDVDKTFDLHNADAFIALAVVLNKVGKYSTGMLIQFKDLKPKEEVPDVYIITKEPQFGDFSDKGIAKCDSSFFTKDHYFDPFTEEHSVLGFQRVVEYYKNKKSGISDMLAAGILAAKPGMLYLHHIKSNLLPEFPMGGIIGNKGPDFFEPLTREKLLELRKILGKPVTTPDYLSMFKFKGIEQPETLFHLFDHNINPKYDLKGYTSKFWFRANIDALKWIERDLEGSGIVMPRILFRNSNDLRDFVFVDGTLTEITDDSVKYSLPQIVDYDIDTLVAAMLIHKTGAPVQYSFINAEEIGECVVHEDHVTQIGTTSVNPAMFLVRKLPASKGRQLFLCDPKRTKVMTFLETIAWGKGKLVHPQEKQKNDPFRAAMFEVRDFLAKTLTTGNMHHFVFGKPEIQFESQWQKYEDPYMRLNFTIPFTTGVFRGVVSSKKHLDTNVEDPQSDFYKVVLPNMTEIMNKWLFNSGQRVNRIYPSVVDFRQNAGEYTILKIQFDIEYGATPRILFARDHCSPLSASGASRWAVGTDGKVRAKPDKTYPGVEVDCRVVMKGSDLQMVLERVQQKTKELKNSVGKNLKSKRDHDFTRASEICKKLLADFKAGEELDNDFITELNDILNNYSVEYGI